MKKLVLLSFVIITFFGCGDEIRFNTPAMQANREGETWRATYFAADIDFGGFLVEGGMGLEVLQLVTPTDGTGTFSLGENSSAYAVFRDFDGTVYSTRNNPDPSVSIYPVEGTISVQEIDNNADPKLISGEFNFTAFSEDGLRSVNFIDGVFNRVSLIGGLEVIND
ncbi:DUF6252 family protein [Winogradskyella tangerina]|uniref:DUF6252 family protein n=1 Tax=Winogradskyella tangerina TaxID=2023240 RepID=UPI000DBE564A|nr:DUF6252 family protein [Winogradskyella tangerina]